MPYMSTAGNETERHALEPTGMLAIELQVPFVSRSLWKWFVLMDGRNVAGAAKKGGLEKRNHEQHGLRFVCGSLLYLNE
jgi:hypothetical protein